MLLLLGTGTTDPHENEESQISDLLLTVPWCASSWTKESHHCALHWRTLVSAAVPLTAGPTPGNTTPIRTQHPKCGDRFYNVLSESLIFGGVGNFPNNGARVATAIVTVISNSVQKTANTAKPPALFRPIWTHIIVPNVTRDLDIVTFNL